MKIGKSKTPTTAGSIRVAQGTYQKAIFKKLLSQLLLAFIAILFVYLCFAATIVRFVPGSSGVVLTKNNTYPGGVLPKKSQALISFDANPEAPVDTSMTGRLKQSFIPQKPSAVVSVLAGPIGKVKWTGGVVAVDGKALPVPFPTDPGFEYLENQYIATCISGDCNPGSAVVFTPEQVLGVPFNQDAEVPVAPPAQLNQGPDRADPVQVVRAYVIESYFLNAKLACGLLTDSALKAQGGFSGCENEAKLLNAKLDRDFDFDSGFLTKLSGETGDTANVDYILTLRGEEVSSVTATLTKTKQGWSINELKEK